MAEKNKTENKSQSMTDIYNSSEAQHNRQNIYKEINSMPRPNYPHAFQKDDKERGELFTERLKWRTEIKAQGFSKRNAPLRTYVRVS